MKHDIQIAHIHLETVMQLSEKYVQLLIVENPDEFFSMVSDLCRQFEGDQYGAFAFSSDGKIIEGAKYGAIISDVFHFDLNDKKITSLLHKKLEASALGENIALFNELASKTICFLQELAYSVPFSLDYSEPQPIDYLKAAGVKLENNYETLEEKIVCYINALIELKGCDYFIFVNLKSALNDEKLSQIYEHCQREQVGLLLIESGKNRPLLKNERAIIITEDLCEILENYSQT